ncbi:Su(P) family protein [Megaselia abdita]
MSTLRIATRQLVSRSLVFRAGVRTYTTVPPKARQSSTAKLALIGTGVGAVGGSCYTFYSNWLDKNAHKEHEKYAPTIVKDFPKDVQITKRYVNPKDNSNLDIVLFQFQTCPFCCKVRAYLDSVGISYSVVEVDAVLRQDIRWSKYKKVPMVLVRQKENENEGFIQLTDSSTIISVLASYMHNRKQNLVELANFYPNISFFDDDGTKKHDIMNKYFLMYQDQAPKNMTKEDQELERKWRNWADHHLVHLISPNCYRTYGESVETFNWFSDAGEWHIYFPKWERDLMVYAGAVAMWGISKLLIKKHKLTEDVRGHIYNALDSWTDELKKKKTTFLGGKQPNLADISVFGILNSMEGCQAFKDCLENTNIGEWFFAMKTLTTNNRGELIREKIVNHQS